MNVIIRKKQIFLGCLIAALGIAVYLNYHFAKNDAALTITDKLAVTDEADEPEALGEARFVNGEAEAVVKINTEYFTSERLKRKQAHDEALEMLNAVINNSSASEAAKQTAAEGIERLANNLTLEGDIESLVKAKGFPECLAVLDGDKARIIVAKTGIKPEQTLRIKEIVMTSASVEYENISIIEAE